MSVTHSDERFEVSEDDVRIGAVKSRWSDTLQDAKVHDIEKGHTFPTTLPEDEYQVVDEDVVFALVAPVLSGTPSSKHRYVVRKSDVGL